MFLTAHKLRFILFFVGAERMLDNIISQQRKIGQWRYQSKADYQVVYSVCVQIKGDIRRGLGLWLEASRDLISSIVLFKTLPKPDKKGWASSLSLLADAFQYMPSKDFNDLAKETQLTTPHPVLEAIRCVTEAAQLCIYNPLFFAKNKVICFFNIDLLRYFLRQWLCSNLVA